MAALPFYDTAAIGALNDQAVTLLKLFGSKGYVREEPSILQPAEIFLDRSGEEIRRRTFALTDPSGDELALRPDLTIPICKHAVESGTKLPARISYNGLAFRYQPNRPERPTQFFQAGVELLGVADAAAGEAEILGLAFEAMRAVGLTDFEVRFGDLALFGALVDALELPKGWCDRLKRNFWRAGYVETLLHRLGEGSSNMPDAQEASVYASAQLRAMDSAPAAGRTHDEIAARYIDRAREAAAIKLNPAIAGTIAKLSDISGPVEQAMRETKALLAAAHIKLDGPLTIMDARLQTIASLGVDLSRVRFTAHFGRNMEYYTGFVFELWARDSEGPMQVAGGGRYDTLLQSLGARHAVGAIGCALRTERLLAARKFAGVV
jgi:ATP phosphoribosyltransferase regulatory subunit